MKIVQLKAAALPGTLWAAILHLTRHHAMVKAMDENLNMEHPERHAIRNMQRIAKQVIEAGLRSATDLAWQAQDLREMARQIEAADKPHNA